MMLAMAIGVSAQDPVIMHNKVRRSALRRQEHPLPAAAAPAQPVLQQVRAQHRRVPHRTALLQSSSSKRVVRSRRRLRQAHHKGRHNRGLQLLQQLANDKRQKTARGTSRQRSTALDGLGSDLGILEDDAGDEEKPHSAAPKFNREELLQELAGVDDAAALSMAVMADDSTTAKPAVAGDSAAKADQQEKILGEAQKKADEALHNNEYERDMLQTQMLSAAQSMHVVKQMAITIKKMKAQVEALEIHEKVCRKHLADLKNGEYQALEAAHAAETVQVVGL